MKLYDLKTVGNGLIAEAQLSDAMRKRFGSALRMMGFNDAAPMSFDAQFTDAATGMGFMVSQLAWLEQQMYEVPYADLFFDQVVPIRTDIPEWADQYQYISYNSTTRGKFIGSHAQDLPTTALERMLHSTNFGYGGLSLAYSLDDMRKAVHLGMNLDTEQAQVSFRGAREHQQDVVFYGDSHLNITGFFNNPYVKTKTSKVVLGTADIKTVVDEINAAMNQIWTETNQRFLPDTICIPTFLYAKLVTQIIKDQAVPVKGMKYLLDNNLYFARTGGALQIIPMPQLASAEMGKHGLTAKNTIVVYAKNPQCVMSFMPIAPRFIAPQPVGLEIRTPMEYKIGGTEWRYPQSAMYLTFAD